MSRLIKFDDLVETLPKNGKSVFKLNGASTLTAHLYEVAVSVKHTNAQTLNTDVFKFWGNIIAEISMQLGTGNDIFELGIREHIYRQIVKRERVNSFIDSTVGDVESKLNLIIDLASIDFMIPQDTVIYTHLYKDKNIYVNAGTFDKVADCTVNDVIIKLKETFLDGMSPRLEIDGKTLKTMLKRPLLKTLSINGKNPKFEIDLPENSLVSEMMIYVTDQDGAIVQNVVSNLSIKNAHTTAYQEDFNELNSQNQLDIFKGINPLFKGVAFINIANGKYSRVINTNNQREKSTRLILNVDPAGASDLVVNVLFETVKRG